MKPEASLGLPPTIGVASDMMDESLDPVVLRAEVARAATIDDLAERTLEIVALVEAVAAPIGIHPVVIGGMAVYFWTGRDEFVTYDIDVAMPVSDKLGVKLTELGFARALDGRHWTLTGTDTLLEAPTSYLDTDAKFFEVKLRSGRTAKVLSRVDILMDRLDEFQATGHETSAQQSLALLADLSDDEATELHRRAAGRGIVRVLDAVRKIAANIATGGAPPDSGELHEIARAALQSEYSSRKL
jgi:hypothetical protein